MKALLLSILMIGSLALSGCTSPKPLTNPNNTNSTVAIPTGQIYFYSTTCPHCQTVKDYINDNNIKQTRYFLELEISSDSANADILRAVGKRCLINENDLSVPLFWDGTKCYSGSEQVISYFQSPK